MSVIGVTLAARTALATAITTGGLTCRKYDTWDISEGNIATLGLAKWVLPEDIDQSYGFRVVTLPVLIYQVIDGGIDQSLGYQETNVENVIDGLAADRTLGGEVPNSGIVSDPVSSYYRVPNGQAYSVVSFDVAVMPFSNAA
jgi:hypothetical protein